MGFHVFYAVFFNKVYHDPQYDNESVFHICAASYDIIINNFYDCLPLKIYVCI